MDATQLTDVVDKLAEKVGVATVKIQPVAEEVLKQYVRREWATMLIGLAIALLGLWCKTFSEIKADEDERAFVYGIFAVVLLLIGAAVGIEALLHLIAPLPAILGL